jgi:hypothetical protein
VGKVRRSLGNMISTPVARSTGRPIAIVHVVSGSFRFGLQRVLDWTSQKLAYEKAALARVQMEIGQLDRMVDEATRQLAAQQEETLSTRGLVGADLHRLNTHESVVRRALSLVPDARARLVDQHTEQRLKAIDQDRKVKTLQKLEERQREAWSEQQRSKETELASELFLAARIRASNRSGSVR